MEKVLVTGGNGLVGSHLCKKLKERGYNVGIMTRSEKADRMTSFFWDLEKKEIDIKALENVDHIVHLAGANIGDKRWTFKQKKLIIDSRVKSAELLFDSIKNNTVLKTFVSASAVGYYGMVTSEKVYTEIDDPTDDFLGQVCKLWEKSADRFAEIGARVVKVRTALVITPQGGALEKMTPMFKVGLGSPLGSGRQYVPWIHIDDLCEIYVRAISNPQMKGAYNAVAPDKVNNKEFGRALAKSLDRPFWFPGIPTFVLKLIFGEMSSILLKGSRVSHFKVESSGFNFKFPLLENALNDVMKK
jgi:uncharacterized protein (TIGR01777 family)